MINAAVGLATTGKRERIVYLCRAEKRGDIIEFGMGCGSLGSL